MKKMLFVLMLGVALPTAEAADMQPGLWEIITLKQIMDGEDLGARLAALDQQLAGLPAAQRQQMQSLMGKRGVSLGGGNPRICIGPGAAAEGTPVIDGDGRCVPREVSRSGNTLRYEVTCQTEQGLAQGKGESTFSADRVRVRMEMTTSDSAGRQHTMQNETEMRYLGADCGGLAPRGPRKP
jgi:hypothetical protein